MGHAARLQERADFEVDVVALGEDAPREPYDVAVATWWETLPTLLELDARRRVVLVQSAEERFYRPDESFERLGAALALTAPVHFVVVARWLEDLVTALRPDARCWFVPNGIDKSLVRRPRAIGRPGRPAPDPDRGPAHALVQGSRDALDVVSRMREPHAATLVALDPRTLPRRRGSMSSAGQPG